MGCSGSDCKEQFSMKRFGLTYGANPKDFLKSQWISNRAVWLIYRFIVLVLVFNCYLTKLLFYKTELNPWFLIYYTNWALTLLLFYEIIAFLLVLVEYIKKAMGKESNM